MKFMKILEIKEPEIAINLEDIANLEKKLNICFPEDYKQHLLKYNGGHPIKDGYPLIEYIDNDPNDNSADIAWFLAIYNGEHNNFLRDYNTFKIWQKRMPDELVSIGCGSGGDQICISVKGNNYGKVYFWNHDWECEEGEEPDYSNVHLIANSFTDFINSLYETVLLEDENGKDLWVYKHDRYSLPVCTEIKKYGEVVKEFFDKAPKDVEEFIIKEFSVNKDLLLSFQIGRNEYFRRINKEGNIIEEGSISNHTKNPIKNIENNHREPNSKE
jgi:hypothetical protein